MNSIVFKLFSDCIPVKGFRRSILYDLGQNNYRFIPNALYEILNFHQGKSLESIKKQFEGNEDIIDEYFNFLQENNYIFWCNAGQIKNFPALNMRWDYPAIISNSIIQINSEIKIHISSILHELAKLGCKDIFLYFKNSFNIEYMSLILELIKEYPYKSVDILLPYDCNFNPIIFENICKKNVVIHQFIIYNSPYSKQISTSNKTMGIIRFLSKQSISFNTISESNFYVDISTFIEAQKFNLFFNRKTIISSLGYITNSINDNGIKWDLDRHSLVEIINQKTFQEKWFICKDLINVCKECEYRYMCIDSRDPIKINSRWIYAEECGYNPYIAKWIHETGYIPVDNYNKY